MRVYFLFIIIIFIQFCKEPPVITSSILDDDIVIEDVDTSPPIIKWIAPRFDAVVYEVVIIECQVIDTSGLKNVDLYINGSPSGISSYKAEDNIYKFNWQTSVLDHGSEPQLHISSSDNEGNDTVSQIIRVIVDNNPSYPEPININRIDSLFLMNDTLFSGYNLNWSSSSDPYFSKYVLQRSNDPLMINSEILFSTSNKSIVEYQDNYTDDDIVYYRILIENIFEKQTPGNTMSNSMIEPPNEWSIHSVNYTNNSLLINWNIPPVNKYLFHQLLYSESRDGDYKILKIYSDSSIFQYSSLDYMPSSENWFLINVGDSLGHITIGQPYMHSHPQDPTIDSMLYNENSFNIEWKIEPDADFNKYKVLQSDNENPFDLLIINEITDRNNSSILVSDIIESEYYLYQIITQDAWGLETRSSVIKASSFYKFSKIIGGENNDNLYSIIPNNAGGYFAIGESYNKGAWFVNIDSQGTVKDSLFYGDLYSNFYDISEISDGGYIILGQNMINQIESIFLVKINNEGVQEWQKNIDFNYHIGGNAIIELNDENIGIVGYANSNNNKDIFVLKLDSKGNELWSKLIGGIESDEGHDILALENGGIAVLGETHSNGDKDGDIWILEFDSDGNSIDSILIQLDDKQVGYSFVKIDINQYIIGGITSGFSGVTDAFIIKVNDMAEIIWEYSFGGNFNDKVFSMIEVDDGLVFVGQTYSYDIGGGDILLLKVNNFGVLEWNKVIGKAYHDIAYDIKLATDAGFIIVGSTFHQNNVDGWIIKTDSRGNYNGMLQYP